MFEVALDRLSDGVELVERMLRVSDTTRSAVIAAIPGGDLREDLVPLSPLDADWRLYDHCAAVTRLYAIYEEYVRSVVQEWLGHLPQYFPNYGDLPDITRRAYRAGTGEILTKYGGDRYSHLTEDQVIRGFADGLAGQPYALGVDAFFTDERNLREDRLHVLFGQVGIDEIWARLTEHRAVVRWRQVERGDQATLQAELNQFVLYRNEASHGSVQSILSMDALLELASFVRLISSAIADACLGRLAELMERDGEIRPVGVVIREFSKSIIGVETQSIRVTQGDPIVVRDGRNAYDAAILSIEIDNQAYEQVDCETGDKIGIKVTRSARPKASVWQRVT